MGYSMKTAPLMLVAVMVMAASVHSQDEDATAPGDSTVAPVAPPVTPKRVLPPFKAMSTVVRRVDVVEPPPMSGLPPVTGTITQTVHLVEDPGLADPVVPPPLPALPVTDPVVVARMKAMLENDVVERMAFVSATVYDNRLTYFSCYPGGEAKNEICGWSNIDFNHFSGYASYQVKGNDGTIRRYDLLMCIGNSDTVRTGERLDDSGETRTSPEFPKLPDLATGGPAFVLTEGDTTDKESVALIQGLHDLYRTEGARMAAAYKARLIAYEQRKAFLQTHPPKPEDVTVLFWERAQLARPVRPALTEGGGR